MSRLLLFLFTSSLMNQGNYFEKFYQYAEDYIRYTEKYVLPKANQELYNTDDATIYDYGKYDLIVIGGGSAGSILSSRLSEISDWNVLLLEAGGDENAFSDVPGFNHYVGSSEMNWGYFTTPQNTCCQGMKNHQCVYPRGKVLGGSGVLNALMYVRGTQSDFDNWEKLGNVGWSYRDVLGYFKKSERIDMKNFDRDYHGFDGPIHVNQTAPPSITAEALLKAAEERGLKQIDYNGKGQLGISKLQFNIDFNKRSNGARGFLDPIRNTRLNLKITLGALVTKILIENNTAIGVEFVKSGKRYRAIAKLEVLLSGGAINSPQLLLLSGIGPKNELEKLGIEVKNDMSAVGKNMKDHPMLVSMFFRTNLTSANLTLKENLKKYMRGETPLTNGAGIEYIGFINTKTHGKGDPDLEFLAASPPTSLPPDSTKLYNLNDEYHKVFQGFNALTDIGFLIVLLQPKSTGSVTLKSNSAMDFPLIDINYFSDAENEDIETMYRGVKFILSLAKTDAFKSINATLVGHHPGCEHLRNGDTDRDYWYCAIRHSASTIFHPSGTTRMGSSPRDSVVDKDCMIHNMNHLRVVDAGIMPEIIRGHTNAATFMIAEKISDVVKKFHGKL